LGKTCDGDVRSHVIAGSNGCCLENRLVFKLLIINDIFKNRPKTTGLLGKELLNGVVIKKL
jgi:hypothetical protein